MPAQHVPPPPPLPAAATEPRPRGGRLAGFATIVAFLGVLGTALWYGARLASRAACAAAAAGEPCAPPGLYMRTAGNFGVVYGLIALFVGFLLLEGRARLMYLALWLSIFCAWLIGLTLVGGVPLALQIGVPALALWGVLRLVRWWERD